ncbi:hypothetical protein ACQPZJ_29080 [Actinoplanes sp. CA-054009]
MDDTNRTGGRMTTVVWPDRRADVITALCVLAVLRADGAEAWPGLTEAVHWLVDDTFWDQHDPRSDIGTILLGTEEAAACRLLLDIPPSVMTAGSGSRPWVRRGMPGFRLSNGAARSHSVVIG